MQSYLCNFTNPKLQHMKFSTQLQSFLSHCQKLVDVKQANNTFVFSFDSEKDTGVRCNKVTNDASLNGVNAICDSDKNS